MGGVGDTEPETEGEWDRREVPRQEWERQLLAWGVRACRGTLRREGREEER